jgi:hypothetical protein
MTKSPILATIDGTDIPYEPDSKSIKNMAKFLKSIKSEPSITIKPSNRKASKNVLRQPIENETEITWSCRFHPTEWFHEVGCPHMKWTKKQLQEALETQKMSNLIFIKNYFIPSPIVSDKLNVK